MSITRRKYKLIEGKYKMKDALTGKTINMNDEIIKTNNALDWVKKQGWLLVRPTLIKEMTMVILFFLILLLVIPFNVHADLTTSIDNKISDYPIITINNGLDVSKFILIENTKYCLINCYAIINFSTTKDNVIPFNFSFFDSKDKIKELSFKIYYLDKINIIQINKKHYIEICNNTTSLNGTAIKSCDLINDYNYTENVNSYNWKLYDGKPINKGNYLFYINATKNKYENIEWTFNFDNINSSEIKKYWASWNSTFNQNLISYWTFNETSGNVQDVVNSLYNWTEIGTINSSSGKIGTARGNTSNGNYFKQSGLNDSLHNIENKNFTIAFWIYMKKAYDWGPIFINARVSSTDQGIQLANTWNDATLNRHLCLNIISNNNVYGISQGCGPTPNLDYSMENRWIHIAIKRDNTNVTLWFNGTLLSNITIPITLNLSTKSANNILSMGYSVLQDTKFNEITIDEMGIWNRSLTDNEIISLFNNGQGISYQPNEITENGTEFHEIVTPNNLSYIPLNNWTFSVDINNTNGSVILSINGTNYTMFNITDDDSDKYETSQPFNLDAGTYNATFTTWNKNPPNRKNQTSVLFTINKANITLALNFTPSNLILNGTQSTITGYVIGGISCYVCYLYREGSLVNNPDIQNLSLGYYTYLFNITNLTNYYPNTAIGYLNVTNVTISTPSIIGNINLFTFDFTTLNDVIIFLFAVIIAILILIFVHWEIGCLFLLIEGFILLLNLDNKFIGFMVIIASIILILMKGSNK